MSTLALIDLSSIWWATWHATEDLEVGEAARRTLQKVHECASDADYVAVCCDAPPYRRSEIYPEYKANRSKHTEVSLEQLARVKTELRRRYPVLEAKGYEADDVVATVVSEIKGRLKGVYRREWIYITIHTSDKDLMQLVADDVKVRSVQTRDLHGPSEVEAKFGVTPAQMRARLALVGDSADNIPGVPGVGPKRAAALLKEHSTAAGVDMAAHKGMIPGKVGEALRASSKDVVLAMRLIALETDAPVDVESIFKEAEVDEPNPDPIDTTGETIDEPQAEQSVVDQPPPAAIVTTSDFRLQLEPTNSAGAVKLSRMMLESRMFGDKWPNEHAMLSVILRGRELGLGAATSLSNFHVIEGKPVMHAHLIVGLVLKSPLCEYLRFVETDASHAVWVTKRRGQPEQRLEFTIQEAFAAELVKKGEGPDGYVGIPTRNGKRSNWDKYRAPMLRKVCGVQLARAVYPDITAGLYCEEELDGR